MKTASLFAQSTRRPRGVVAASVPTTTFALCALLARTAFSFSCASSSPHPPQRTTASAAAENERGSRRTVWSQYRRHDNHKREDHRQNHRQKRLGHEESERIYREPVPKDAYVFPVGRALHYVRVGRHFYRRHDGQHQLEELLNRGLVRGHEGEQDATQDNAEPSAQAYALFPSFGSTATDDFLIDTELEEESPLAWRDEETESATGTFDEPALLNQVARFTNYHCHHVKVNFKARRDIWTRQQAQAGPQAGPLKRGPDNGNHHHHRNSNTREVHGGGRPFLLTVRETNELLSFLFQASLLLHITALFGVSERYLESLLAICLSCSIFLSQQHNSWRHGQTAHQDGGSGLPMSARFAALAETPAPLAIPAQKEGAPNAPAKTTAEINSLHWAIVHYCEGARLWGLLEHSGILFPVLQGEQQSTQVFAKLLQAHAGLLLSAFSATTPSSSSLFDATSRAVASASRPIGMKKQTAVAATEAQGGSGHSRHQHTRGTQHYLQSLLGGAAAQRRTGAIAAWFGTDTSHVQQRCLQLLPTLWTSMLIHHIQYTQGGATPSPGTLSMRAVRHAFLRLVPLYAADGAGREEAFWAMASVLYGSDSGGSSSGGRDVEDNCASERGGQGRAKQAASHVEVAALLSAIERSDRECQGEASASLLAWLSEWRAAGQAAQQPLPSPGDALSPSIKSSPQLYRALLNIPLACCPTSDSSRMPIGNSSTPSPSVLSSIADEDIFSTFFGDSKIHVARKQERTGSAAASSSFARRDAEAAAQTIEGLSFMNELLFRTLLQWRAAQLPTIVPAATVVADAAEDQDEKEPREEMREVPLFTRSSDSAEEKGGDHLDKLPSADYKRMLSYSSYLEELVLVLSSAMHLAELHRRLSLYLYERETPIFPPGTVPPELSMALVTHADLAEAVQQSVEAAVRALAEQLGNSVFPARRQGLAWSRDQRARGGQKETDVAVPLAERRLLLAIHDCVARVLTTEPSPTPHSAPQEPAGPLQCRRVRKESETSTMSDGRVPEKYQHGLRFLLEAPSA